MPFIWQRILFTMLGLSIYRWGITSSDRPWKMECWCLRRFLGVLIQQTCWQRLFRLRNWNFVLLQLNFSLRHECRWRYDDWLVSKWDIVKMWSLINIFTPCWQRVSAEMLVTRFLIVIQKLSIAAPGLGVATLGLKKKWVTYVFLGIFLWFFFFCIYKKGMPWACVREWEYQFFI